MEDIAEILRSPAHPAAPGGRVAALLAGKDEFAFGAMTLGDIVYDRFSIDPSALQAFEFVNKPSTEDIFKLATWSHHIIDAPSVTLEGRVSWLQGYVFERMAALTLHQSGKVVQFPETANNPGWDFLVNGEKVQAKCGIDPRLVTDHLNKYPNIQRVVVDQDLAEHFAGNDYITAMHDITRDTVRATTEHSLNSAADMLDLHLGHFVPALSVARNAYHVWRGNTDWRALGENVSVDAAGRFIGATAAGHAIGVSILALGLGGWPAILLPVFAASGGYRGGRVLSDLVKRRLFLRTENAALHDALAGWCQGAARVHSLMMSQAQKAEERIAAARERSHPGYQVMFDDWRERLATEQGFRRLHLEQFTRGTSDPWAFDDGRGPLEVCAAAMVAASRSGLLPADLSPEKKTLIARIADYAAGLRRRLLSA
jgi:hypothetical protein